MKGLRVTLIAVALLALPFAAGFAQGSRAPRAPVRSGVRPTDAVSDCKDQQAAALARAAAEGRDAPYGLDKKCDDPVPPPPPNQPPVASFTASCSALTCSFTSTSSDPDGTIASYSWAFGDGGTSGAQNPSYSYAAGSTYTVSLQVTDNLGAQSAASNPVTATPPPPPPSVPPPPPPPPQNINDIQGMVFEDIDGNGSRDPFAGEMGLMGWEVSLYDASGVLVSSTTTDDQGNYVFAQLLPGGYSVCVTAQPAYVQTYSGNGLSCGGAGWLLSIPNNQFPTTTAPIDFGEMLRP